MKLSPEGLARSSSRHPWRTVAVWIVLMAGMGALTGSLIGDALGQDVEFTNDPESVRAEELLERHFRRGEPESTELLLVGSKSLTVDDARYTAAVGRVQDQVAALGDTILVGRPASYYDVAELSEEQAGALVSEDGRTTLISVGLRDNDESYVEQLRSIAERNSIDGFTVQVAGQATLEADMTHLAEEDLVKGESIGIGAALLVLIVVFAALVAAVVPIVMALFAIGVALGLVSVVGQVFEFNLFVTNMVTTIGLAVGIDYSLFIVSRYREERRKGFSKLDAIGAAGATANRAVFFSGLMVVLALLGMLIVPSTIFVSLAGGAILVTLAAVAASMTLLPAILALLGDRINWPGLSRRARVVDGDRTRGGMWDRITRRVMARPAVFLLASLLVLGGLGAFYSQLNQGTATTVRQLPDDVPSKDAFLTLEREFGGGLADPVRIVIAGDLDSPSVEAAVSRLRGAIADTDAFVPRTEVIPSADGSAVELDAYLKGDPSSNAAFEAIRDLRSTTVPAAFAGVRGTEVLVGGSTASNADFTDVARGYQWIVVALVLALSFVLLTVVFRSVVVPVKAILMNLLSVAAAYGALTLVFQKGVGIDLFNAIGFQFQRTEAIESWVPLFLFSVLFGLSMDYHVFLLTRIREEYDKTRDNTEAVAYGLRTTAGIITGAALIMVAVFTGFAAGRLGPMQQMGFGLAVAVLLDATIVRAVLVPATMRLLGDRNWYLPRWLGWLPRIEVEGREPDVREVEEAEPVLVGADPR